MSNYVPLIYVDIINYLCHTLGWFLLIRINNAENNNNNNDKNNENYNNDDNDNNGDRDNDDDDNNNNNSNNTFVRLINEQYTFCILWKLLWTQFPAVDSLQKLRHCHFRIW